MKEVRYNKKYVDKISKIINFIIATWFISLGLALTILLMFFAGGVVEWIL
jgi:cell division protein FtsX